MVKDRLDYDVELMVYISVMTLASGERKQREENKTVPFCIPHLHHRRMEVKQHYKKILA